MKNKVLFGLSLLFGLMMINSGLNKFFHYMPLPEMPEAAIQLMQAFGQSGWLMPLVGVAEIVGGALFISPKFRALGAMVIFPVVIGILLFNLMQAPANAPVAVVLLLINLWVIYENREKYQPMINSAA